MSLHQNSQLLVDTLEKTPLLHDRFKNIKLVNFNALTDQKRGCFSLVFQASDSLTGKLVALKFYDLDPQWTNDQYRVSAFQREHTILKELLTVDRCMQLASAMSTYILEVKFPDNKTIISIACQYFAVEWLDQEIDKFFLQQENYSPLQKLLLFNEIVLSVEALHRKQIFHRDLKSDNLRAKQDALKRIVVAIDLGTAARSDSGNIQSSYSQSVGAPAYAAPESLCGLAGNRNLARYTDIYALGCLLFELFNHDYFFHANRVQNALYGITIAAMAAHINNESDQDRQLNEWRKAVSALGNSVSAVLINGPGNNVPPGLVQLMNELVSSMTHVNFSCRPSSMEWIRSKTWSAIKLLKNEQEYKKRVEQSKERRRRKIEKVLQNETRLALRLQLRKTSC